MEESLPAATPDALALDLFSASAYRAPWPGQDDEERPVAHTPAAWATCHACGQLGTHVCPGPTACPEIVAPPDALAELDALEPGVPAPEQDGPDQVALFDLGDLTQEAGDVLIRKEFERAGLTPEAQLKVFEATTIRQVVLLFQAMDYPQILADLTALMQASHTDTHTEALTWLLRQWTSARPNGNGSR
jgi:hypothetical protein